MIDRASTLVTGPQGAGKTSLIERLVASNRSRWVAAIRVREEAGLTEPHADPAGNEETRRWQAAGEVETALLQVPVGWRGDVFDVLEAVDDVLLADVMVVEGDVDFWPRQLDAAVFVAQPGEPLLVDEQREVGRLDGHTALSLALGLPPVDQDEELPHGLNPGDVVDEDDPAFEGETLFEVPDEVAQAIERLLKEGRPLVQRKRWLRRGWEALPDADLVVIGSSGAGEGEAAERLRNEVLAVRKDEKLRREVTGSRLSWPRSCFVAALHDRRDAGTVKVVQAIKRRWRQGLSAGL